MAPGAKTVEGLALALAAFQQAREERGVVAAASALGELAASTAELGQLVVAILGDEQQLAKALEHHAADAEEGSLTDALAQSVGHVIASFAKYAEARSTGRLHKELKHAMRLARHTESLRSVVALMSEDSSSDEEGEQEQEHKREHQHTHEQEEEAPQPRERTPRKTPPTEEVLTPGSAPATMPPPATPAEESGGVPQAPPNSPAEELPPGWSERTCKKKKRLAGRQYARGTAADDEESDPDAEPVDGQQLASATSEMSPAEEHDTEEDDDDADDEDYDVEEEEDDDEPATERKPPRPKGSPPAAEPLTVTASSNSLDARQKVKARRRKQL